MKTALPMLFLLLFAASRQDGLAQQWGGDHRGWVWQDYSVNANAGVLSYFGDLSLYDTDPFDKLKYESRPAFGIIATKDFINGFGISGQVLYGQFEGGNSSQTFNALILEYNLHLRAELVQMLSARKDHRISFSPYAGIGQFMFSTRTTSYRNELVTNSETSSRVPEFVYFAGAGLSCALPAGLAVTADLGLRQCRNDKLDGLVKNENFDYYSYLSLGITFRISSILPEPLKNKARLAHNERFLMERERNKGD